MNLGMFLLPFVVGGLLGILNVPSCGECDQRRGEYVSFVIDDAECLYHEVTLTCGTWDAHEDGVRADESMTEGYFSGGGGATLFEEYPHRVSPNQSVCILTVADQRQEFHFEISRREFDREYPCGEWTETLVEVVLEPCEPGELP